MNSGIPWELLVGGMTFGDKGLGSIEREIHWAENFMKPTKLPLHNIMLKLSVSHPNGLQQGKLWVSLLLDFAGKSIYKILLLNTVQFRNPELFTEGHILLLLSRFSHVQLCATPWMAAHQAPLSLGFSRQEHWSGLPFPSPMHESEKWKWSRSVMSDSSWPHGLQPTWLLRPWDFPGKSTGVGCHCLLQATY